MKGIIHIHSEYSHDGKVSLENIKRHTIDAGYSFACITEHVEDLRGDKLNRFIDECEKLSDDKFLFIPGVEFSYSFSHVLVLGVGKNLSYDYENWPETLKSFKNKYLMILAHPYKARTKIVPEIVDLVDGIEVWNSKYNGKNVPSFTAFQLFQKTKLNRNELLAFAGLDFHKYSHFGGPFVSVVSQELDAKAILQNLKDGEFKIYSRGVSINPTHNKLPLPVLFESMFFAILMPALLFLNKFLSKIGFNVPLKEKIRNRI